MGAKLGDPDRRAVAAGAAVGALATVVTAALGDQWVKTVVLASPVISLTAGVVAARTSRERMQPFREGAFAGAAALPVGILCWMAGVSVVLSTYPLDVFLLLSPFGFVAFFVSFPVSFFVGGVGGHVALSVGS